MKSQARLLAVLLVLNTVGCSQSRQKTSDKTESVPQNGNAHLNLVAAPTDEKCFEFDSSSTITGYKCPAITDIVIPDSIDGKKVGGIADRAFENGQLTSVVLPNSIVVIGKRAFENNRLSRVILPDGLIDLREEAFENNQLTSLSLPEGITEISTEAFMNNQITAVVIPKYVNSVGQSAFENNKIASLKIFSEQRKVSLGDKAFKSNKLSELYLASNVKEIGSEAFRNNQLTNVEFDNREISIYGGAFCDNKITYVSLDPGAIFYPSSFDHGVVVSTLVMGGGHQTVSQGCSN